MVSKSVLKAYLESLIGPLQILSNNWQQSDLHPVSSGSADGTRPRDSASVRHRQVKPFYHDFLKVDHIVMYFYDRMVQKRCLHNLSNNRPIRLAYVVSQKAQTLLESRLGNLMTSRVNYRRALRRSQWANQVLQVHRLKRPKRTDANRAIAQSG